MIGGGRGILVVTLGGLITWLSMLRLFRGGIDMYM